MAQLTCGVITCGYNKEKCCCKGDIMVGPVLSAFTFKSSAKGLSTFPCMSALYGNGFRIAFVIGIVLTFCCLAINTDGLAGMV